jgi:hypothetical protein
MQRLQKAFRLLCLLLFLVLATLGIGLSGGIALPTHKRREERPISIELVESEKEKPDANVDNEQK